MTAGSGTGPDKPQKDGVRDNDSINYDSHDDPTRWDPRNKHIKLSVTRRQINWRRGKVAELDSKGYLIMEIADILKVSVGTVHSDLEWLREQAKESIRVYTEEKLPYLFDKSIIGLTQIIKESWKISANAKFDRTKIESLKVVKDAIVERMNLAADSRIIEQTATFIVKKRKVLEQLQADEWDEDQTSDELVLPPGEESPVAIAEDEPQAPEQELAPEQEG